jgi:2'-5' RNA ligase/GNAT superfamily N-acetyltransferase
MRVGAALLLAAPLSHEIDGLRRALGDDKLERVPPHLTLVPPVNLRHGDLGAALAVLRAAAAAAPDTLTLDLGPPAAFLPANPVVYLAVGGQLDAVEALRRRLFSPPLARELSWPFVAHVTLAELSDPDRAARAAAALGAYGATAVVDRVHLLQEVPADGGRRWLPLADASFGAPAIVGRGGLALELSRSQAISPEAAAILEEARWSPAEPAARRLVVTARREGAPVALGVAWMGPDGGQVAVIVDPRHRRQGIGSHVLAAVEQSVRSSDWGCSRLRAIGPAGFYTARSLFSLPSI